MGVMHSRSRPSGASFLSFALEAFSNMPLETETEVSPMWYSASFKSQYIRFGVSFDIRDACVDCAIKELKDVESKKKIDLAPHCPLYGYLIKNKGYRGSLNEFKPKDVKLTYWKMDLLMYSGAILHFFEKEISTNA